MEFNVNEISTSENELEVKLNYDEIKSDIDSEVKKQSQKIQLPGFRKGKVPPSMLKKFYGDSLEYEASEKVANHKFWEIAEDQKLNPIGQPVMTDIDFKPGNELKFKVKYEIIPELAVKGYTDQTLEVPDFVVGDDEINKEIEYILKTNSTFEDASIIGDDLNYKINAKVFRLNESEEDNNQGKGEALEIDLTNEGVQPQIRENAKGKKVGESFNFSFEDERTIKNSEGKDEKVKEVFNYRVDITGIQKIVKPELTEELIKKVTKDKASTENELRENFKKDLQHYYDHQVEDFIRNKLISLIIKENDFTPPSTFVSNILNEMIKSEEQRMKEQGVKKINHDELKKHLKPGAENEVKWYMLKSAIQKKENIEVSDQDLEDMAKKDSEKTGLPVDKLLNYYKSSNQHEKLLDKKLFEFLTEKNNIKKVEPSKLSKPEKEETNA